MTHHLLLQLHLLGAAIWTGGHLVLATSVLPRALQAKSIDELSRFEAGFERIGIPALLTQVVTGVLLAWDFLPPSAWLDWSNPVARTICVKLGLLLATALLAVHARLVIIPKLTPERLPTLAWHIVPVTVVSVVFVLAGASFRVGGW